MGLRPGGRGHQRRRRRHHERQEVQDRAQVRRRPVGREPGRRRHGAADQGRRPQADPQHRGDADQPGRGDRGRQVQGLLHDDRRWADWIEKDKYQWTADYLLHAGHRRGGAVRDGQDHAEERAAQEVGHVHRGQRRRPGPRGWASRRPPRRTASTWGLTAAATPGSQGLLVLDPQAQGGRRRRAAGVLRAGRRHHLRQADEGGQLLAQVLLRLEGLLADRGHGRPRRRTSTTSATTASGTWTSATRAPRSSATSSPPTTTAPPR